MTDVEELILENQHRIMAALAVLMAAIPSGDMARLIHEGAELSRKQVAEWGARAAR